MHHMTLADLQTSLRVTNQRPVSMILALELLKYGHEKIIQGERYAKRTEGLGSAELVFHGPRSTRGVAKFRESVTCKFIPKDGIPF
jgi:hypothetical protein